MTRYRNYTMNHRTIMLLTTTDGKAPTCYHCGLHFKNGDKVETRGKFQNGNIKRYHEECLVRY